MRERKDCEKKKERTVAHRIVKERMRKFNGKKVFLCPCCKKLFSSFMS